MDLGVLGSYTKDPWIQLGFQLAIHDFLWIGASIFYQPRSGRSCIGVGQKLLMVTYEFLAIVASMFGDFQYLQIFSTNFINYFPPITIDFH